MLHVMNILWGLLFILKNINGQSSRHAVAKRALPRSFGFSDMCNTYLPPQVCLNQIEYKKQTDGAIF